MILILLQADTLLKQEKVLQTLLEQGVYFGLSILKALVIFLVGRLIIRLLNKLVKRILEKQKIEPSVRTFLESLTNVVLIVMLIMMIIGTIGLPTTSFAALIASVGVALGMALSGNLSNFAGGIIILIFRPFKVGDIITTQNITGTVHEIAIFYTILKTPDNLRVYIPNGSLSSGVITNFNVGKRRIEWIFSVDYGVDYEKVKIVIESVLAKEAFILSTPAPFIELHALENSSVNVVVRVWVKTPNYWTVYFNINKTIYETFNAEGINFPFPQLTVHQK
ncbi:MAG: mechanosensitive ion channel [Tannerellaceae bacterium]|jgi:small conductance mechanosensitive channel|nr:mechanosensitive ion channel [Tannerellaceae bacterium]